MTSRFSLIAKKSSGTGIGSDAATDSGRHQVGNNNVHGVSFDKLERLPCILGQQNLVVFFLNNKPEHGSNKTLRVISLKSCYHL